MVITSWFELCFGLLGLISGAATAPDTMTGRR